MKIIKYFFLILFIINGCQNENENPIIPSQQKFIIPLSVGNQWLGKAERIGTDGQILGTSDYNNSVLAEFTNIDSIKLSVLQIGNGQRFYCTNKDSGFVYNFNDQYHLQYKYPGVVGEKYSISGNAYREIISTDTTIITEYGKFKCYHYSVRFYDNEFHTEEFISPNIGFIYYEHYQTDGPTPEIFLYSRITYIPMLKD
jgi:hypothetical protein